MGEIKILNQIHEKDAASLAKAIGEKDFEEFLMIQNPAILSIDRSTLVWKITSRQIERLQREVRQEIKTLNDLNLKRKRLEKQLEAERAKTFKNNIKIEHLESMVLSLSEIIKSTCNILSGLGELVATNLELRSLVSTVTMNR